MRILVVDDEKAKRLTLRDDLAAQGHDIVTAADGQEAVRQMEQMRFDVVVTDLRMPRPDGIELLKQIKQGPLADTEVIMMTAYGSIPVAVEAVKLGAFDFLTKPFRNEEIFPLIARIEHGKRSTTREREEAIQVASADIDESIVGRSAAVARVKRMVEISGRTDSNVLLYGKTGV
ncbi:MAG: response regulator, partial [Planctomycetota bacterium]